WKSPRAARPTHPSFGFEREKCRSPPLWYNCCIKTRPWTLLKCISRRQSETALLRRPVILPVPSASSVVGPSAPRRGYRDEAAYDDRHGHQVPIARSLDRRAAQLQRMTSGHAAAVARHPDRQMNETQRNGAIPRQAVLGSATFQGRRQAALPSGADRPHVVYPTSGRAAIALALRVLDFKAGERVLVPTYH